MEFNELKEIFCDVLPVMYKAAPVIAGYVGSPITYVVVGLLAAITNCDAHDHAALSEKLKNDPDVYSKLAQLESTHAKWLKSIQG